MHPMDRCPVCIYDEKANAPRRIEVRAVSRRFGSSFLYFQP